MENRQKTKLSRLLAHLERTLFSSIKEYIVNIRWGSEEAGLAALKGLWRGGPLNRLGLAVLIVNVVATAYLGLQGQRFPILRATLWEGEEVAAPSPALYLSLVALSFAWSYLLAGAATSGLGIYVFAAAYIAYYGLYVGLYLAGSLLFALVPLWMLVLGGWVASFRQTRWRLPLLLLLSLMVALLTRGSLGLKGLLPGTWGSLVLGGIYWALVANPWAMRERPFKPPVAFAVSFVIFGSFYTFCLKRSPAEEVFGYAFLGFHGLLGVAGLFWYWVGLDLFNNAEKLAQWLSETIKTLAPRQRLGVMILSLLVLWSVMAYLLTRSLPPSLTRLLQSYAWGQALLRAYLSLELPMTLLLALDYHLYFTAAILFLAFVLWLARRLSLERLMGLFGLSLLGFFILWGYFGLLIVTSQDSETTFGFWPLLIFAAGTFWAALKASPDLTSGPKARSWLFLGFLLLLGGISLLELTAGYPYFERALTLNPFLGVLYLGLPYLLYSLLYQQQLYTPVSAKHLLLLFALGMLSAIPSLIWQRIFIAPLFWLVAVLSTVWRWERWDERWDGLAYTIAPALGFVTFCTHPVLIPVPAFTGFLGSLLKLQERYEQSTIWPWEARWWWISLGAVGAAVILGYLSAEARLTQGRTRILFLFLGLFLGVVFLIVCEAFSAI